MEDLQRSIPSMVDGLKSSQRKILFCSFKMNFVKEIKVAEFSGYVYQHFDFLDDEQGLVSTIIGMAQDFVGSSNINLLQPNGQFGTRLSGGKDHAIARHIYTKLSPITRILFPKEDDCILEYMNEDGLSIAPKWYVPIIPMVLVNGSEGIGTGWSSYIPNYNPREIVQNIRRLLNAESMKPINPWYRGFKGSIEKIAVKEAGATYTIKGIIKEIDSTTVAITELPIQRWTEDYEGFLESSMTTTDKAKEPFIKDYRSYSDDTTVHFEVILSEENLIMAKQEGLEKTFKLTTTIGTSNMHLLNPNGIIKKYNTPEEILEEFFHIRISYYEKRKKALLDNLELELLLLDNQIRFILGIGKGEIILGNKKEADLILWLQKKGFTPIPKKTKSIIDVAVKGGVKPSDYDYLLSMPSISLTHEKIQGFFAEKEKAVKVMEELKNSTPSSLWKKELDALEKALDELERQDAEAEEESKAIKAKVACGGVGNPKEALMKPRKNNAKASTATEPITVNSEIVQVVNKPKPRERKNKSTAKQVFVESDENEELVSLKNRLAAYKLESSSEASAMDTETVLETVVAEVPKSDEDPDDEEKCKIYP